MNKLQKIKEKEQQIKILIEEVNKLKQSVGIPKAKAKIDFKPIIRLAQKVINSVATDGYYKDCEERIFEEVMVAIYGKDIWNWWDQNF